MYIKVIKIKIELIFLLQHLPLMYFSVDIFLQEKLVSHSTYLKRFYSDFFENRLKPQFERILGL